MLLLAAFYVFLLVRYRHFEPFYDGGIYYRKNIVELLLQPFQWYLLHMEQHPSVPYTLLIAAGQWLDQGNMILLLATNLALAVLAAGVFYAYLRRLFGKLATPFELWLCTLLLALNPVLLVHAFHLNLDYPLVLFFVMFLYALRRDSPWLVIVTGLLLLFTKEMSALYYAAAIGLHLLYYVLQPSGSLRSAGVAVCRRWYLLAPGAVYAAYHKLFWFLNPDAPYWGAVFGFHPERRLGQIFVDTNLNDPSMQSFLVNIFLLNYLWILSSVILLWAACALGRWSVGRKALWLPSLKRRDVLFHILLLAALAYGVTRVRPWNNPRYALVAYPVLIVVAEYALIVLIRRPAFRIAALAATLALTIPSNFRTIDPLSKKIYGLIRYGNHDWLNMVSIMGPEGVHLDMQAYNLELLELDFMMDEALRDLRPQQSELLLVSPLANFYLPDRIDPESGRNSWRLDGTGMVRWNGNINDFRPETLPNILGPQRVFHYLAFPNLRNDESLAILSAHNRIVQIREYGREGYTMKVYTFMRNPETL